MVDLPYSWKVQNFTCWGSCHSTSRRGRQHFLARHLTFSQSGRAAGGWWMERKTHLLIVMRGDWIILVTGFELWSIQAVILNIHIICGDGLLTWRMFQFHNCVARRGVGADIQGQHMSLMHCFIPILCLSLCSIMKLKSIQRLSPGKMLTMGLKRAFCTCTGGRSGMFLVFLYCHRNLYKGFEVNWTRICLWRVSSELKLGFYSQRRAKPKGKRGCEWNTAVK